MIVFVKYNNIWQIVLFISLIRLKGDSFMKRFKRIVSLLSIIMMAVMLTSCLSIDMKVAKNGSLDMTYTVDTSQLQGMMSFNDIEKAIEDSVDGMNDSADKKIAKLKSIKENKKKKTVTAIINVKDINKIGDGSFFGTVKEYRKKDGYGLDDLVNTKDKSIDEKKVSDKLQMVYFPLGGTEQYGMVEVTVTVPGNIEYITDGGEVDKKNVAVFSGENPLVIFRKSGGFSFWLLLIIAVLVVGYFMMKKKKIAPKVTPVQTPEQPNAETLAETTSVTESTIEPKPDSESNPTE